MSAWGRVLDVLAITVAVLFVVLAVNSIVEDLEDGEWWLLLVDVLVAGAIVVLIIVTARRAGRRRNPR